MPDGADHVGRRRRQRPQETNAGVEHGAGGRHAGQQRDLRVPPHGRHDVLELEVVAVVVPLDALGGQVEADAASRGLDRLPPRTDLGEDRLGALRPAPVDRGLHPRVRQLGPAAHDRPLQARRRRPPPRRGRGRSSRRPPVGPRPGGGSRRPPPARPGAGTPGRPAGSTSRHAPTPRGRVRIPGVTNAATSAMAYCTRNPPPGRRSRWRAWSRSRLPGGSIVTNVDVTVVDTVRRPPSASSPVEHPRAAAARPPRPRRRRAVLARPARRGSAGAPPAAPGRPRRRRPAGSARRRTLLGSCRWASQRPVRCPDGRDPRECPRRPRGPAPGPRRHGQRGRVAPRELRVGRARRRRGGVRLPRRVGEAAQPGTGPPHRPLGRGPGRQRGGDAALPRAPGHGHGSSRAGRRSCCRSSPTSTSVPT